MLGGRFGAMDAPADNTPFIATLAADGTPRWMQPLVAHAMDLVALPAGAVVAAEYVTEVPTMGEANFLTRYDAMGQRVALEPVYTGNLRRVQRERIELAVTADQGIAIAAATSAYQFTLGGHMLTEQARGIRTVWRPDGTFDALQTLVEDGDADPRALFVLADGRQACLTDASGPYDDPQGRKRRYRGAHLAVYDGVDRDWALPAWETEDGERGLGPSHLFAVPGGGLVIVVSAEAAQHYLGQSLEPGASYLLGIEP